MAAAQKTLTLAARTREPKKNLGAMRKAQELPAVFYGTKTKSTPITLQLGEFVKAWRQAGESGVITLDMGGKNVDVLIHEADKHPVTGTPIHVDFYAIDKDRKVTVDVPLGFDGEAPIVKGGEGALVKVMHEIEVEALPKDLPQEVRVDVSQMEALDSTITVKDIALPQGVETTAGSDEVVVSVATQVEEEEEPTEEPDLESIEVEQKGKDEEGEGGAGEGEKEEGGGGGNEK